MFKHFCYGALANGVWQQTAFYHVFEKLQQAGGGTKEPIANEPRPKNPAIRKPSHASKPKAMISDIATNKRVLGSNGNGHNNSVKPQQKRPASLVRYYA